jgi:hypothetical protein
MTSGRRHRGAGQTFDWRLVMLSFTVAISLWYYVNFYAMPNFKLCVQPLSADEDAMREYRGCLEEHQAARGTSNNDTGIKP